MLQKYVINEYLFKISHILCNIIVTFWFAIYSRDGKVKICGFICTSERARGGFDLCLCQMIGRAGMEDDYD